MLGNSCGKSFIYYNITDNAGFNFTNGKSHLKREGMKVRILIHEWQ